MTTLVNRLPQNMSGEAFISQFVLFIDRRGSELLSNRSALKLQPRCLEYLAARLSALRELLEVRSSNPIEYFTGAVADLDDYKRLKKIKDFLEATRYLKLHSAARGIRDPTPVNLSPFRSLTTLELRGCDLSSQCVIGLDQVCESLEKLVCQDCLEALSHVLNPPLCQIDQQQQSPWPKLRQLSCMYNSISVMDASLHLAPKLELLDLSRNSISEVANMGGLSNLRVLDLSHNRLSSIEPMLHSCVMLQTLILKGNAIRSLAGIEDVKCLEELDVRWNLVGSLKEVARVAQLPEIRRVGMEGNPVAMMPSYRIHLLGCFPEAERIVLDERVTTEAEKRKARRVAFSELGDLSVVSVDHFSGAISSLQSSTRTFWQALSPSWLSSRGPKPSRGDSTHRPSPYGEDSQRIPHKARRRVVEIPKSEDLSTIQQRTSLRSFVDSASWQQHRFGAHSFQCVSALE